MSASRAPRWSLQRSVTEIPTQQSTHKVSRLSRFATYIGLGSTARAHSPITTTLPGQLVQRSESPKPRDVPRNEAAHGSSTGTQRTGNTMEGEWHYFRGSDRTWHNPNVVRMMDAVSCTIMTNGIFEPIPRHLNAHVMGIIEEFRNQQKRLRAVEADLEDHRNARQRDAQNFATEAVEWEKCERNYQSEIMRLEDIIAQAKESISSVTLARAGSVVSRRDAEESHIKLDCLSRSESKFPISQTSVSSVANRTNIESADEDLERGKGRLNGALEVRTSPNVPVKKLGTVRPFTTPRVLSARDLVTANVSSLTGEHKSVVSAENNGDVRVIELFEAPRRIENDEDAAQRMIALEHFYNTTGQPCPPSNTASRRASPVRKPQTSPTSPSSSVSCSTSTNSSNALGDSVETLAQDKITPRTTPPPQRPKIPSSTNALAAIQKWREANGSLPEDAVGDESDSEASFVQPCNTRAFSSGIGGDEPGTTDGLVTLQPSVANKQHSHHQAQPSQLPTVPETDTIRDIPGNAEYGQDCCENQNSRQISRPVRSSSSFLFVSMGYNHVTGTHIDDEKAARDGSPPKKSPPPRRPSRITQGSSAVVLSQETIDAAHQGMTIANLDIKTRSPVRPEDFRPLPPAFSASRPLQRQRGHGAAPIQCLPGRREVQNQRIRPPPAFRVRALL